MFSMGYRFFVYSTVAAVVGLALVIAFEVFRFVCCTRTIMKALLFVFSLCEIALCVYAAIVLKNYITPLIHYDDLCVPSNTVSGDFCSVKKAYYWIAAICTGILCLVILMVIFFTVKLLFSYHKERKTTEEARRQNMV
mmetsp:Transcript_1818/g.2938  ORF Transcript_1818/g.2938 Transcript_1818/m.2938 type:complete len:138 (-) Transcript_1818:481-894(-)